MSGARLRALAPLAGVFLVVLAGRLLLTSLFAESVPYWDQWDAEGARLLKPWLEGQLDLAQLFAPHNEHRVVFSRLLSLALFEANQGQWDNLVLAQANGVVYAGISVLLYALLAPGLATRVQRLALAAALCLLAWLPFGHTNALVGFQNQFFAMSGFAAATLGMAALGRDRMATPVLTVVLALCGLFTMASGLLAAVAAGGVLVLRAWQRDLRPGTALAGTIALAAVAALGYGLIPHIAGHATLQATGLAQWLSVFILNLAWPIGRGGLGVVLIWTPFVIAAVRAVWRRDLPRHALVALGLGAWVLLQCAAIAYSRGGEASIVGRYVDTLAIGLLANFWLAMHLAHTHLATRMPAAPRGARALAVAAPVLHALLVFGTLTARAPEHLQRAAQQNQLSQLQTENVRRFVATGQAEQLDQPFMEVPYPDPSRLAELLSDPTLRPTLPASIRTPLRASASQAQGIVQRDPLHSFGWSSCPLQACATARGAWHADFPATRFGQLVLPQASGGDPAGLSVSVSTTGAAPAARTYAPGAPELLAVTRGAPFQLTVTDASPTGWIAFGAPVEIGRLSALSRRLQAAVRGVLRPWVPVPDLRRFAPLPVSGHGDRQPLKLSAGDLVEGRFASPRTGLLERVSITIGNYFDSADGTLLVEVCSTTCTTGRADLRRSLDNSLLELPLAAPLPVMHGTPVRFAFRTEHATHPVALWLYPRKPGSPQLQPSPRVPAEMAGQRAPRLGLMFLQ